MSDLHSKIVFALHHIDWLSLGVRGMADVITPIVKDHLAEMLADEETICSMASAMAGWPCLQDDHSEDVTAWRNNARLAAATVLRRVDLVDGQGRCVLCHTLRPVDDLIFPNNPSLPRLPLCSKEYEDDCLATQLKLAGY